MLTRKTRSLNTLPKKPALENNFFFFVLDFGRLVNKITKTRYFYMRSYALIIKKYFN